MLSDHDLLRLQMLLTWTQRTAIIPDQGSYSPIFLNTFPNKPWILRVCSTSLLKTQWEKENCSLWAISPFPTVFSTRLDNFLPFLSNLELSSANSFSLEGSKSWWIWTQMKQNWNAYNSKDSRQSLVVTGSQSLLNRKTDYEHFPTRRN